MLPTAPNEPVRSPGAEEPYEQRTRPVPHPQQTLRGCPSPPQAPSHPGLPCQPEPGAQLSEGARARPWNSRPEFGFTSPLGS